jgi:phosphoribosylanthranilate isomerase
MIDGIRIKICGLTSLVDAEFADKVGADYLGFILYPQSPRFISLKKYAAMNSLLPPRKRVAVMVEPTADEIAQAVAADFDYFQIHFRHDLAPATVQGWSEAVDKNRLWLAPKLPPAADVPAALLPLARFFLLDTFQAEGFGGSGKTGDWAKFARHQKAQPDKFWILSGGLNPQNVGDALKQSGAKFVDVNSGVEASPGIKDTEKLKQFIVSVHKARMIEAG